MLRVTPTITLKENEIHCSFVRAAGPGGQNVNKVATAVQIRFEVKNSPSLPEDVRKRVLRLGNRRITEEGVLIITAKRFRAQERNRQDGIGRLVSLIRKATTVPKPRRKTKPPKKSIENRIQYKKGRGLLKKLRKSPGSSEE